MWCGVVFQLPELRIIIGLVLLLPDGVMNVICGGVIYT